MGRAKNQDTQGAVPCRRFTRRKTENHGTEREWSIYVSLSPSLFSALPRVKISIKSRSLLC